MFDELIQFPLATDLQSVADISRWLRICNP